MPSPTKAVTNSIYFNHLYFGRRGRENQHQFKISSLKLSKIQNFGLELFNAAEKRKARRRVFQQEITKLVLLEATTHLIGKWSKAKAGLTHMSGGSGEGISVPRKFKMWITVSQAFNWCQMSEAIYTERFHWAIARSRDQEYGMSTLSSSFYRKNPQLIAVMIKSDASFWNRATIDGRSSSPSFQRSQISSTSTQPTVKLLLTHY